MFERMVQEAQVGARVLVCGGRDYDDWHFLCEALDAINDTKPMGMVIQGGARGADALARAWADARGVACLSFPALWRKHGRAAGPIRNKEMLDEGCPHLVVAFPGGRGTDNMCEQAHNAGVKVFRVFPARPSS